jgi:hypothetical protein
MSLWRIARDVVHSMDITAAVGPERLREIMADLVDRASTSNTNGTLSTTVRAMLEICGSAWEGAYLPG